MTVSSHMLLLLVYSSVVFGEPCKTGRRSHCLVIRVISNEEHVMYAVGGRRDSVFLQTIEEYDPKVDDWESIGSLATATAHAAISVSGHNILVYGGLTTGFTPLDSIQSFNLHTNSCTIIRRFPHAIGSVKLVEDKILSIMYLVDNIGDVYEYTMCGNPKKIGRISGFPREKFGFYTTRRRLFVVGGNVDMDTKTDIIQYDIDTGKTVVLDDTLPLSLEGFDCLYMAVSRKHLTNIWSAELVRRF